MQTTLPLFSTLGEFSHKQVSQKCAYMLMRVLCLYSEIARYLLAVPPSPKDKEHKVRMAYGNGMRPDVWQKFRERYGVRVISEFFASSEVSVKVKLQQLFLTRKLLLMLCANAAG